MVTKKIQRGELLYKTMVKEHSFPKRQHFHWNQKQTIPSDLWALTSFNKKLTVGS
jgi:hypothetical protein